MNYRDLYRNSHDPVEQVLRCHSRAQSDIYLKCGCRSRALKAAFFPDIGQEATYHALDAAPRIGIIGLEHVRPSGDLDRLFQHRHGSANGNVPPVLAISIQRAGSPDKDPLTVEEANCVNGLSRHRIDIKIFLLQVG